MVTYLFTSGLAICTMNVFYIKMTYTQDIDVNATSGNANGNANGNMSGSSNGHTAHTSLSDLSNHGYDDNAEGRGQGQRLPNPLQLSRSTTGRTGICSTNSNILKLIKLT